MPEKKSVWKSLFCLKGRSRPHPGEVPPARPTPDPQRVLPTEPSVAAKDSNAPAFGDKAQLWIQAAASFKKDMTEDYKQLEIPNRYDGFVKLVLEQSLPDTLQVAEKKVNNVYVRRLKEWLPALGTVKTLSMTLATLDPHKLAPYIVAGSFFLVEVSIDSPISIFAMFGSFA